MVIGLVVAALGLFIGVVAVTIGGGATAGVPLLLLMGHSAAQSIATVKFALLGSFVTGSLAHRGDAAAAERKAMPWVVWPLAVVGSVAGSLLVVGIDDRVLKIVVALLMVVILWITHRTDFSQRPRDAHARLPSAPVGVAVIFGLCVYSGFFGAGFGTFLIFALMHCYGLTFGESASVMTRINLLVVGASVTTFISSGVVDFRLGIPLFVGCAAGGWLGAWVARVTNPKRMKAAFQAFTLLLGAKLLWEAWAAG
ncbi:sulfite exporter TauE/SafE family protein [Variovorax boronicumulans]|uniref:sulfite exporter TauE/SafE family protein n=1 Tax=Variovorax boronicumulans TaxID=436515 RepID=UPI00278838B8|nr:sulfite exporter TauE/SafE family protein [Variovorax boronicumulans]MDP9992453.1 putative membrane protein YfcA [Variovorax boronicumulans]